MIVITIINDNERWQYLTSRVKSLFSLKRDFIGLGEIKKKNSPSKMIRSPL
jgi:hypothetical protein